MLVYRKRVTLIRCLRLRSVTLIDFRTIVGRPLSGVEVGSIKNRRQTLRFLLVIDVLEFFSNKYIQGRNYFQIKILVHLNYSAGV